MIAAQKSRSRAGRPKVEELAERTDALLATTEALLIKLGYERTTLNVIAKEAGVSKQTIYAKYGGKPGLLRAVLQRASENSSSASLAAEDDLPLYEGLLERVRRLINIFRSENAVGIVMISVREGRKFPEFRDEMLRSREQNLLAPLRHYLEHLRARGLIKNVDCGRVASMLLWSVSEELLEVAATGVVPALTVQQIEAKAAFIAGFYRDAITRFGSGPLIAAVQSD
ncbi:TetR family transcriptional regulator [Sphingobium herbicidovorans NBRC 16415]|uniref:TetR family transcriptional regulator n=2 Tax=Sphingobium herbicidovorans TaxID=76947 RepID=A0A086P7F2_SPHHM|nr:TetR/AcrR family transcriptional regulator [Sphingobium herbicidovorans]KFG89320.1 TetR family transcriptional regulator [Sphingobium herbicidovorans NBRC 16415]